MRLIFAMLLTALCAGANAADTAHSVLSASIFPAPKPLFEARTPPPRKSERGNVFADEESGGLFAALPGQLEPPLPPGTHIAARLRDLIAQAEAGPAGYDAVQHGAWVAPPRRPTDMTLKEIFDWVAATPGQPHAIGRYQFIPSTLRHSAKRLKMPLTTRFSPAIQDKLGNLLLGDAGLDQVISGALSLDAFILNLAKIWAGLPTRSGRSYYHGVAGNKAVLSFEVYASAVRRILDG